MHEVPLSPKATALLEPSVRPTHLARFQALVKRSADRLDGRTLWHVNSTAEGGGVAELLHQVLGYLIDGGIRCRWLVVGGDQDFFWVTKRIHNRLHGSSGDGGPLDEAARDAYLGVLRREIGSILELVRPGDVAVVHDPQTAGMIPFLVDAGLRVVWVCHVGVDAPTDVVRSAWDFLRPDVEAAHASVFSRRAYVWEGLDRRRVAVIPPCIDPTSPKNVEITAMEATWALQAARVLEGEPPHPIELPIEGIGSIAIRRGADAIEEAPAPTDRPLVTQVSRWDRLKDHVGVLRAFSRHVREGLDAHLLLVGPAVASVTDDPEGAVVLAENIAAWERLPLTKRRRIHIVSLPVDDRIENALVVNALQSRADVVVQKSLAEGFGLTVAEAMWKRRPIVGSEVGGIQDQIVDGRSGILVDPTDAAAVGRAISTLVRDAGFAQAIGHAARERVRGRFLPPHFLGGHLMVIERVLAT
ncbi:MAG TPA: glycosyltransferase [Actinomycetota bacterium]|nr:glycosyltransferase [Actinomycetota bacterium]